MLKNDDKILKLKTQIEEKKKLYKDKKKFSPITSCILYVDDNKINLHTVNDIDSLNHLLININTFKMSAENLNLDPNSYKIDGFGVLDWILDINQKIEVVKYNNEIKLLEQKEKQLDKLLSEDKKTELELLEIEKLLNE